MLKPKAAARENANEPDMAIDGISSDPLPDVLQARLRELALQKYTSEVPLPEANVRSVELEVSIAQADIFLAIQDERLRRLTAPYERRRNHRASEGRLGLFDQDFVARLVRVESLKRGIRSRRHSEQEAVEASTEITFVGLPSIEQRAAEIVLSRRRAARNNPRDPASRIACAVRREWFSEPAPDRPKKSEGISLYELHRIPIPNSSIVRIAVPILDQLAGKPIASGIPTSRDVRFMKPAGMAALFAIVQLEYRTASFEHVYKALLKFRLDKGKTP